LKELEVDQRADTIAKVSNSTGRMYYADWIRVIAVYCVIFVHCLLNAADTVGLDDRDAQEKKDGICKILAQVGMPLFFYISGLSLTFVNPSKTTYFNFFKNKVIRLLVPFTLACLTLLIPRLYLS
jgi:peptidoglycan/LPS O-acetylase OafA/YrhL